MSHDINIPTGVGKREQYESLIPQLNALVIGENDIIANVANIIAALKYSMNFLWVGIYRVDSESDKKELVLGPFQGPVACTRISYGKGVCGKAWEEGKSILVEDIDTFPGHIACSSLSRSEIVIPVVKDDKIIAVLDVDSTEVNGFDEIDRKYLEEVSLILARIL